MTATTATTMSSKQPTLIVVVGPTGSGKTSLAVALARHYSAPIISTDSRQFYRGLPIGTAQPTAEELSLAEHHFIADRDIDDDFNSGRYEHEALARLDELFKHNDVVIAVGGSGLYIQALCEGMDNLPEANDELRQSLKQRLESEGVEPLFEELRRLDPAYAEVVDRHNPARIMRALEVCITSGKPYSEQRKGMRQQRPFRIVKIGTDLPRDVLYERINLRVHKMVELGLLEEARCAFEKMGVDLSEETRKREGEDGLPNSLNTVGYKELLPYFRGEYSLERAIELIQQNSRHYAKRQMTWWRRQFKNTSTL